MAAEKQYIVDEAFMREFWRLRNKIDKMSGPGVDNKPQSITIHNVSGRRGPQSDLPRATTWPAEVSGQLSGGAYTVTVYGWKQPIPTDPFTWATHVDTEKVLDSGAVLLNQPEQDRNITRIDVGSRVFVSIADTSTEEHDGVYTINYTYAIRKLRIKPDLTSIQKSTADKDSYSDDDFSDELDATTCDETQAGEFFSF